MTMRLSISALAGSERTDVAVGTVRDSSMLDAMSLAGPRSFVTTSSTSSATALRRSGRFSAPADFDSAFTVSSSDVDGLTPRSVVVSLSAAGAGADGFFAGAALAGVAEAAFVAGAAFPLEVDEPWADDADRCAPLDEVLPADDAPPSASNFSNTGHQDLSTEFLSDLYCSYISSTNHWFDPKSEAAVVGVFIDTACFALFHAREIRLCPAVYRQCCRTAGDGGQCVYAIHHRIPTPRPHVLRRLPGAVPLGRRQPL